MKTMVAVNYVPDAFDDQEIYLKTSNGLHAELVVPTKEKLA